MAVEHRKYGSKHAGLYIGVQGNDPILHQSTGTVVGHKKELGAAFAIFGAEQVALDDDGEALGHDVNGNVLTTAWIRGNFWDSERAQQDNGWTDDETEAVIAKVEYFVQRRPGWVWRLETPKFAAPWPSYDDMHHNQIATTAQATGQIAEALLYEEQNKARPVVVERLTALLNESRDAVAAEAALTAA